MGYPHDYGNPQISSDLPKFHEDLAWFAFLAEDAPVSPAFCGMACGDFSISESGNPQFGILTIGGKTSCLVGTHQPQSI